MKKILLLGFAFSAMILQAQQSFSGLRNSPYAGVFNVTSNPASLAGGMKKWHVNLFSADINFSNNVVPITTSLANDFKKYTQANSSNPLFAENDINTRINTDILAPSFMFSIGDRLAFAISTRSRILADIKEIDAKIFETFLSDLNRADLLTYPSIKIDNQSASLNSFAEIGASGSFVALKTDNHTLKFGVTAKYVRGAVSSYAGFHNFSGSAKIDKSGDDTILNITGEGEFVVNAGGINVFNGLETSKLTNSNSSGFAFDLGAVYEFRFEPCPTCAQTPYDFKIGASVTDLGKVKYTLADGSYTYKINTGSTPLRFNLQNMQESLDAVPVSVVSKISNAGKEVSASLPTAFRFYADARLWGKLFVDFEGQFDMTDKNEIHRAAYANAFVITPRIEGRALGLYIPISNTSSVGTNVGAALRLGPLVVGSNTIISNFVSKNSKALNVFFGLQFGK